MDLRSRITSRIKELEEGLALLDRYEDLLGILEPKKKAPRPAHKGNGRAKLSKETLKLRQYQGRYMSAVRVLGARDKARITKIRESKGYPAALAAAKKLGG
jgi:hypothetical protein